MPLFRKKKPQARQIRVKKFYREDGSTVKLTEEQDRKSRRLDAETNWEDAERLKELGKSCIVSKYFDLAEWIFERVMELDPDDDEAIIQFSSALLNQKRWDEAEEIISNHLLKESNSSVAHQFMSVIHEKKGDYQKSMDEMQKAIECDPNNERALWMVYWKTHRITGDKGALRQMEELAARYPKAWGPTYVVARHFEDLDPDRAKEDYETALQRDDTDAVLLSYTAFLGKTRSYSEMIKVVERSRKERSVDFRVLFNLGEAYLEEGKVDKAYDVSLELQASVPPPYKKRLKDFIHRVHTSR
jgi:tetratricopeptide (TPR) repeat protein